MDLISTAIFLVASFYFYHWGRENNDLRMELLGIILLFLSGIIIWGTQIQYVWIDWLDQLVLLTIPASGAFGFVLVFVGVILSMFSWEALLEMKKESK